MVAKSHKAMSIGTSVLVVDVSDDALQDKQTPTALERNMRQQLSSPNHIQRYRFHGGTVNRSRHDKQTKAGCVNNLCVQFGSVQFILQLKRQTCAQLKLIGYSPVSRSSTLYSQHSISRHVTFISHSSMQHRTWSVSISTFYSIAFTCRYIRHTALSIQYTNA